MAKTEVACIECGDRFKMVIEPGATFTFPECEAKCERRQALPTP